MVRQSAFLLACPLQGYRPGPFEGFAQHYQVGNSPAQLAGAFVLALLLLFPDSALSQQSYTYYSIQPAQHQRDSLLQGGQPIMKAPADDSLSSAQSLPFSWQFYNTTVDSYYVSDNGFISFQPTSPEVPSQVPDANPPNQAVYVFTADWRLSTSEFSNEQPDRILKATFGQAPNRVHVIRWSSVSAAAEDNPFVDAEASFALLLFEQGGLEMLRTQASEWVEDSMQTLSGLEASMGQQGLVTNQAGNAGFATENFGYPGFRFKPSNQPLLDLGVIDVNADRLTAGIAENFSFTLKNFGDQPVQHCRLHYSINGFMPVSTPLDSLGLQPHGDTTLVVHPTAFAPGSNTPPGTKLELHAWCDSVNGAGPDNNPANDTLERELRVVAGQSAQRKVLLEEFWLSSCGFCPDARVRRKQLRDSLGRDQVIALQYHGGDALSGDALSQPFHQQQAQAFRAAASQGVLNREYYPDKQAMAIDRGRWLTQAKAIQNSWTPLKLELHTQLQGDHYDIQAKAHFTDYPPQEQLALGLVLKAKALTGAGNGFEQRNYYSQESAGAGGPDHPFYPKADPVSNFTYKNVALQRLTPAGGALADSAAVASLQPGDSLSWSFSGSLDSLPKAIADQWLNGTQIQAVGWVATVSPDIRKRTVLNAAQAVIDNNFTDREAAGEPIAAPAAAPQLKVAPNPAGNPLRWQIRLPQPAQNVTLELRDPQGRVVHNRQLGAMKAGVHRGSDPLPGLSEGVYYLSLRGANVRSSAVVLFKPNPGK